MKLKNRFLACTTALFLFCSLTAAPVLAADQPAVALSSADAKAGDTVKLTVSLRDFSKAADPDGAKAGNPIDDLFSALQLKVYYDADVFTPAAYGLTDEQAGKPSPVKLDGDWAADLVKRSDAGGDYLYCGVLCLSGDGARLSDDQDILDLTLQVKADAPSGDYALKTVIDTVVTGIQGEPKNVGGQFTAQNGAVKVEGKNPDDGSSDSQPVTDPDDSDTTDPGDSGSADPGVSDSDSNSGADDGSQTDQTDSASAAGDTGSTGGSGTADAGSTQTNAGDAAATSSGRKEQSGQGNPKTGEAIRLAAGVLLLGLAGAAGVVLKRKSGK